MAGFLLYLESILSSDGVLTNATKDAMLDQRTELLCLMPLIGEAR